MKQTSDGPAFRPSRIVSGGQTGVDRAGLDVAIDLEIEHGGWCPAGRLAEDGVIPDHYRLTEHDRRDYAARTRQNVIDSDATLIIYQTRMGAGTSLTRKLCIELDRPFFVAKLGHQSFEQVQDWLAAVRPPTLNVAGSREKSSLGIHAATIEFLLDVFGRHDQGSLDD